MDADDERVARAYAALLARHGPTHHALHWASAESQGERFQRLANIGIASGASVLDVGCGLGDFLAWFRAREIEVDYTGIDITDAMIAHCQKHHHNARFVLGNLLDDPPPLANERFDWVVASGVFAFRKVDPWGYMQALITRMLPLARHGVAFNTLSARAPHPEHWTLFHADPDATQAFCQATGWLSLLIHTPDLSDFTVHLWRRRE